MYRPGPGDAADHVADVFAYLGLRMAVAEHHAHDGGNADPLALSQAEDMQRVRQDWVPRLGARGQQTLTANPEREPAWRLNLQRRGRLARGDRDDLATTLLIVTVHEGVDDRFTEGTLGNRSHRPALGTDDFLIRGKALEQQVPCAHEGGQQWCRSAIATVRGDALGDGDQHIKLVDIGLEVTEQQRARVVQNGIVGVIRGDPQSSGQRKVGRCRITLTSS